MEAAYLIHDRNLGCRILKFEMTGSYITTVIVEETSEELYNQFEGGVMVEDVIYSFDRNKNYKILKVN